MKENREVVQIALEKQTSNKFGTYNHTYFHSNLADFEAFKILMMK